mgnify:CR=1 FL=1
MKRKTLGFLLLLCAWAILVVWSALHVDAQQPPPPTPQEEAERLTLELTYVDREHKQCRVSLSDVWRRANSLEMQVQILTKEKAALAEELKAAKEQAPAQHSQAQ